MCVSACACVCLQALWWAYTGYLGVCQQVRSGSPQIWERKKWDGKNYAAIITICCWKPCRLTHSKEEVSLKSTKQLSLTQRKIKQEIKPCLSALYAWVMVLLPEPVRAAGALREKLLTARLWPRCFRLHAVRHLESMLCLIRYQSDSVMPNLWNKWPIQERKKMYPHFKLSGPRIQLSMYDQSVQLRPVNIHLKLN